MNSQAETQSGLSAFSVPVFKWTSVSFLGPVWAVRGMGEVVKEAGGLTMTVSGESAREPTAAHGLQRQRGKHLRHPLPRAFTGTEAPQEGRRTPSYRALELQGQHNPGLKTPSGCSFPSLSHDP